MKNKHHSIRRRMVVFAIAGLFYSIHVSAVYGASFEGLGYLLGGFDSGAYGVSADGSVVVGYSTSASGTEAFRWTRSSGMAGLGYSTSGGTDSWAWSVSADGGVVVGSSKSASGTEAFRWTSSSGMTGLGNFPGGTFSLASDVSDDGNVIVGYGETGSGADAFRWTSSSGMINIGNRLALGVSGDGNVVAGQTDYFTAFSSLSSITGLGDLPGGDTTSAAYGVSADGSVIVGHSSSFNGTEAAIWISGGGVVGLGANTVNAYAVSADGSIVGGGGPNGAFVWDSINGTRLLENVLTNEHDLDLTGWTLNYVTGISADGSTIVGFGTNPNGYTEAWAANLSAVPIPATFWLFGSGLISLFGIARKKSLVHQNN